jgi:carboxyl-terminal processing protease
MRRTLLTLFRLSLLLVAASCAAASTERARGIADPGAAALRLATFDTVWATIRDSHYDAGIGSLDWVGIGEVLRPRAAAARTDVELRVVIAEMLGRLGESHFAILPREVVAVTGGIAGEDGPASDGGVGLELRVVGGEVVITRVAPGSAAEAAGVRAGWAVDEVDGRGSAELFEKIARESADLEGREREMAVWRALSGRLSGERGSTVPVVFRDGSDRRIAVRLERRAEPGEPVRLGNLPVLMTRLEDERVDAGGGDGIGLIRFNIWMVPVARAFDEAMDRHRDTRGLIVDLRGNPGGVAGLVMGIGGHFFEEPVPLGLMIRRGSELRFAVNPRRIDSRNRPVHPYSRPVAILIDRHAGSTSELLAGGMQSQGRARIFGERSAGQALPSIFTRLPNGDVLQHAIADLILPDGVRIEGRGVVPDEPAPLTRADLLAGRDPALLAAVEWILAGPSAQHARIDARENRSPGITRTLANPEIP